MFTQSNRGMPDFDAGEQERGLLDRLRINPRDVEAGLFMGHRVETLSRNELLAIIGFQARAATNVDRDHAADLAALMGRGRL